MFYYFNEWTKMVLTQFSEDTTALQKLKGKIIQLSLPFSGKTFFIIFHADHFEIQPQSLTAADLHLIGSPLAFLRFVVEKKGQTADYGLQIKGDLGVAEQLQTLQTSLLIDWEAVLAHYLGDSIAHHIGQFISNNPFTISQNTFKEDLRFYLQNDVALLPTQKEIGLFLSAVDTLRDDTERLSARLQRLLPKNSEKTL